MTNRRERMKERKQWWRKLVPLGISLFVFVAVNSTINQAPYSREDLQISQTALFFITFFVPLYLLFALLFRSRRRGGLLSLLICGLLLFRLYGLTEPMNVLLLFVFIGFLEWYFAKHDPSRLAKLRREKEGAA